MSSWSGHIGSIQRLKGLGLYLAFLPRGEKNGKGTVSRESRFVCDGGK
jgi:hypothetical protein